LKPINPERKPNLERVFLRLRRLYFQELALLENGAPPDNFLRKKFESLVEESKIDWDEVEAAVDRWESKPPLTRHD
jgi:hypothetical protein